MFKITIPLKRSPKYSKLLNYQQFSRNQKSLQFNSRFSKIDLQQLSYVHGGSHIPLKYKTIGQELYGITHSLPQNQAIISMEQNVILSYEDLLEKSEKMAAALRKLGLNKHDRIGIYSPNNYEWTVTQFAASLADLILVNINPAYQRSELEYCLNKVNIRCLVTASQFRKSNYIEILNKIAPELKSHKNPYEKLDSKRLKDLNWVIKIDDEKTNGFLNFQEFMGYQDQKDIQFIRDINVQEIKPDDLTNIQFTSGTTGSPKGASLSHFNILNNAQFIADRQKLTQADKICIPVPLYHCFGMVLGNLCALNKGCSMVYPSEYFSAKATLESVNKHKCTSLYGVPTMFTEYFKEYENNPDLYNIESLRTGVMAGALCPQSLMEKVINIFGMPDMTIGYGMTECSPLNFQTNIGDSLHNMTSTVGTIHPHVEAKIVDSEGKIVPRNVQGELHARGYLVMKGYFNDEDKTNETIDENGWIMSGDIGQIDEHGYLRITGRIKDMIIRGGENIYPKEIEEFMQKSFPEIMDVQVIGLQDEKFGEEVCAVVRLNEGNDNFDILSTFERFKGEIAHYKIPKYIKVVDKYPLTVTGKVQKFVIKEEMEKQSEQNLDQYILRKK